MNERNPAMLAVSHLSKDYLSGYLGSRVTHAVRDVSFTIGEGEIFGIIGESGCGKTTLSRMIMGLLSPTFGSITYEGEEITKVSRRRRKALRREIQMIYQHPQKTLNPRGTVYTACREPIRVHRLAARGEEERALIEKSLRRVGITADQMGKYPHEISGGQAQRVSIARTLLMHPRLLICDEPTSMLDISVQAQIMALLKEINEEEKLAMIFISHNLDIIENLCQRVAVMKDGEIVEMGRTEEVFSNPSHPYTQKLAASKLGHFYS